MTIDLKKFEAVCLFFCCFVYFFVGFFAWIICLVTLVLNGLSYMLPALHALEMCSIALQPRSFVSFFCACLVMFLVAAVLFCCCDCFCSCGFECVATGRCS